MTDWSKLKVPELKAELKRRDLAVTGLKADLVAKLEEDDRKKTASPNQEAITPEKAGSAGEESAANIAKQQSELPSETPEPPSAYIPTPSIEPVETQSASATQAPEPVAKDGTPAKEDIPPLIAQDAAAAEVPSLSRVDTRELTEDLEKRKRRSPSPPPAFEALAQAKRQKIAGDGDDVKVNTTTEDAQWVEGHNNVDPAAVNAEATEVAADGGAEDGPTLVDTSKEDIVIEHAAESLATNAEQSTAHKMENIPEDHSMPDSKPDVDMDDASFRRNSRSRSRSPAAYDRRSRTRSRSPRRSRTRSISPARRYRDRSPLPAAEDRSTITPAIHPATSALYIRDFQRPLNKSELQDFITDLATAPGQSPDPDVIVNFFLDSICTHAFVEFSSTTAASRVRSLIHGRTWPQETTRRPLWADFIPDTRVSAWIATEKDAQDRRERKKWEVVYTTTDDEVIAQLQETGAVPAQLLKTPSDARGGGMGMDNAPRGPRADRGRFPPQGMMTDPRDPNYLPLDGPPSGPRDTYAERMQPSGPRAGLRAPEASRELVTEPPLTFVPVADAVAASRLAHIEALYAPDPDADFRVGSQKHRYTFDRDTLIDRGVEVFEGIRKPPGVRRMPLPADITGGGRRPRGGSRGGGGYSMRDGRDGRDGYRGGGGPHGGGGGAYMDAPRFRDYRDGGMRGGARGGFGGGGGGGGFDRQDRFGGDRWTPSGGGGGGGGGGGYGGGGRLDRGDPNPYPPRGGGGGYGGGGGGYGGGYSGGRR